MKTVQVQILTASDIRPNSIVHPLVEFSILAGMNTRLQAKPLTNEAIKTILNVYNKYNFALHSWKNLYDKLAKCRFEPLVDEVPEPEPHEGKLYDLRLDTFGTAKLLVVEHKFNEVLMGR